MQKPQLHRITATLLALLVFVSSVGMSSYARYCGCADEVYNSLFLNTESACCHHPIQQQEAQAAESCCSLGISKKKQENKEEESCQKSDNCCHTDVKYFALDADATLVDAALNLPSLPFVWDFIPTPQNIYPTFTKSIPLQHNYIGSSFPNAPPPKSGRQLLQFIQVMRC